MTGAARPGWFRPAGPLLFAVVAAVVVAVDVYPGGMTNDSVNQLSQAVRGEYDDWHPPVMAMLWRLFVGAGGSPAPWRVSLLVDLQIVQYWATFFLASRAVARRSPSRPLVWAPMLVALLPPLVGISGVAWKDVLMATSWSLGVMLVVEAREQAPDGRVLGSLKWLSLLLLCEGLALRRNAPPAAVPLFWLWWKTFVPRRRAGFSVALVVGALVLNDAVESLVGVRRRLQVQQLLLMDLAELRCSDWDPSAPWPPESLSKGFDRAWLCDRARVQARAWSSADPYVYMPDTPFQLTSDPRVVRRLAGHLVEEIRRAPGRWLAHKARMFHALMADNRQRTVFGGFENRLGLESKPVLLPVWVSSSSGALAWLYNGYLWGAAAVAGLLFGLRRQHLSSTALFASSLVYLTAYFPTGLYSAWRYLHWAALACALGWVLLMSTRAHGRMNPPPREAPSGDV
ncbi:MAG: hypothetical protein RL199_156 [Pseudomonadota bacterium]|jgi:hypothetical protein